MRTRGALFTAIAYLVPASDNPDGTLPESCARPMVGKWSEGADTGGLPKEHSTRQKPFTERQRVQAVTAASACKAGALPTGSSTPWVTVVANAGFAGVGLHGTPIGAQSNANRHGPRAAWAGFVMEVPPAGFEPALRP